MGNTFGQTICQHHNVTDSEFQDIQDGPDPFQLVTEGYLILVIGLVGLLGNIASIWTFSRQRIHRTFHNLLLVLTIFDTVYVICSILHFSAPQLAQQSSTGNQCLHREAQCCAPYCTRFYYRAMPYILPIMQITLMGSVYCTIALAMERFIAVCFPFQHRRRIFCTRIFVIPVVLFVTLYNIPHFFHIESWGMNATHMYNGTYHQIPDRNGTALKIYFKDNPEEFRKRGIWEWWMVPTTLRNNETYVKIYINYMNLAFNMIIPFLVLLILNFTVYTKIKDFEQNLRHSMSVRIQHFSKASTGAKEDNHGPLRRQSTMTKLATSFRRGLSRNSGLVPSEEQDALNGHTNGNGALLKRQDTSVAPRRREVLLSKISVYIVFMLIICHSVRFGLNAYEMQCGGGIFPRWLSRTTNISHVLLTLVTSFNFFIYYFKHGNVCKSRENTQQNLTRTNTERPKRVRKETFGTTTSYEKTRDTRMSFTLLDSKPVGNSEINMEPNGIPHKLDSPCPSHVQAPCTRL